MPLHPFVEPSAAPQWATKSRLLRRVPQVLLMGLLVACFISIVFGDNFWRTLVYSECIAVACWSFIDGGRLLAARWVHRSRDGPLADTSDQPDRSDWPGWPWMVGCMAFGTLVGVAVGNAAAVWLLGVQPDHNHTSIRGMVVLLVIALVPSIGATYFFWSRGRLQNLHANAEAAHRLAAENQLRLLESQLEPHMLFNTLANLRVLIGLDPPRAQLMLDHLIGFLRATLSASRVHEHPLALEFARLADYLALMKVRMGDRLLAELQLPEQLAQHPVPPLLLQPLVENAIKHGLEPHVEGGRLQVSAALEAGQLVLRVRDTGAGLTDPGLAPASSTGTTGTGFGLQQVRDRLSTLYGAAASFELTSAALIDAEGGTLATVRLPTTA